MIQERCLSDFWREDKSDDRVMELASVLMGADSIIGVMGSGVRAVWSTDGQSATVWVRTMKGESHESRVFLDYSPLATLRPPFGGQAVDEVTGYGVHEGGHCLWSDPNSLTVTVNILKNRTDKLSQAAAGDSQKIKEILRIGNILEDAYIDFHVSEKWPVLGEYIRWARSKIADRRPIDHDAIAREARPARNSIMNLWIGCSLYDKPLPDKMSARVRRAMTFLMSKSIEAVREENTNTRTRLSVECWEYLVKEFPDETAPLPRQAPPPQKQPQEAKPEKSEKAEGGKGAGEGEGEGSEEQEAGGEKSEGEGEEEEGAGESKKQDADKDNVPKEGESEGRSDKEDKGEEEAGDAGEAGEAEEEAGKEGGEPMGGIPGGGQGKGEQAGEGEEGGEPGEGGQEHGHFSGEAKEDEGEGEKQEGDKQPQEGSQQGGDEQGAPGNLDEFDVRDLGEVPEKILQEVMDAISHEMEDLSKSVAEVINRPVGSVMAQTKKADYDGPAAQKVREAVEPQIQEMRRLWDRQAAVQSRHIKGLTTGKLDTRSLARVGTGNLRVNKRREVLDTPDIAIGLLLDVSGSMSHRMGVVWMTGAVFGEALVHKQGVNFLCLTYTGGSFNVQTTRICDREMGKLCIGNVDQGGGTPSGPAIASIKVLMDRFRERQKVIIHFTDGDPDDQACVVQAAAAARKAGYTVWAIAPQGYEGKLQQQYGEGNWETISSIQDLPAKVAELVEKLVASR